MKQIQTSPAARFGHGFKFPFNIFADDEDRVLTRLDDLHKSVPSELPEKRFFKH